MKSARIVALLVLVAGLAFNEWAFKFISSQPPIDSFMRLMAVVLDGFLLTLVLVLIWKNNTFSDRLKTLLTRYSTVVSVFIGLFLAYCTFLTVEFSCRYYFKHFYKAPYTEHTYWEPSAIVRDSAMGSILPRDTTVSHAYVVNDSLIYKQYYRTDHVGRRITPNTRADSAYSDFVMITGCSFAFGYGLNAHQTLGYYVDSLTGMHAYNYAVSGYGTQQTLEVLKTRDLHQEIREPNGVLIHLFIDDHIKRLIGSRRLIKLWATHFPYYHLENGELKRDGSFWTGRQLQTRFYRAISESAFIGLFDIDVPWHITGAHLRLFAAVIREAKNEFLRQYPDGRFIVVIGPNAALAPRIDPILKEQGVEVLDCSRLLDKDQKKYRIHWTEGHPNAQYHLEIADTLRQFLNGSQH